MTTDKVLRSLKSLEDPYAKVLLVDSDGRAATVDAAALNGRLPSCSGAMVLGTNIVLRALPKNADFPTGPLPEARPIYAQTKYAVQEFSEHDALIWKIGFQADNGFCVPDRNVLRQGYTLLPQWDAEAKILIQTEARVWPHASK
ncbi:hypothetical protein [Ralstonia phage phiRSL1]|uniref:Uncharacterized protein n=1 Tax=Ralstonia phage phiRSL1 TaxID=1980924 RepID=B2ZXW3_9CAUD|nr:hypothetical protein RSL1_ORF094 [Ralstonia phage phiRSL1]BAG41539.1 hypothetical protein [Ralstonia phage phiRSL1]